jgi:uncharacterized membrane protein YoaK (UPF0700 family)
MKGWLWFVWINREKTMMNTAEATFPEEIEESLAVALAMVAGFLDAYGFITYNIYVSFMSGNTTRTGYETGQGNFAAAAHSVLPIICFLGGSFAGALLAHSSVRRIRRLVFGLIAASLALIIGFTQLGFLSDWVNVAVISFTMGAMNTALSGVGARSRVAGQTVSLTFVSGTLSRIGMELALAVSRAPLMDCQGPWDTHVLRALRLATIWAGFLIGALLSGAATPRLGVWALLFPMLTLVALAAFDRSSSAQSGRSVEFEEVREAREVDGRIFDVREFSEDVES